MSTIAAPITCSITDRSADHLDAVLDQEQVETNPLYQRDIDGDGNPEPWCNVFTTRVCRNMGCPIPEGMRANEIAEYLDSPVARADGWEKVDAHTAQRMADEGQLAVPAWVNPVRYANGMRASGHVAVLRPSRGRPGVWAAQAGARRFSNDLLIKGFGPRTPTYFVHP